MRYLIPLLALVSACSATEPRVDAVVEVTSETVEARDAGVTSHPDLFEIHIPYRVANVGSEPVSFFACPTGQVQVLSGAGWRLAWGGHQLCTLAGGPVIIPPGESRELELHIVTSQNNEELSWRTESVAGIYRLLKSVFPAGSQDRLATLESNAFQIIDAR